MKDIRAEIVEDALMIRPHEAAFLVGVPTKVARNAIYSPVRDTLPNTWFLLCWSGLGPRTP